MPCDDRAEIGVMQLQAQGCQGLPGHCQKLREARTGPSLGPSRAWPAATWIPDS